MTTLLRWEQPSRSDRGPVLHAFTCTQPAKKVKKPHGWEYVHPRKWELTVQGAIRTYKPPPQVPHFALAGYDDEGIGAFVCWEELDGVHLVELRMLAVSERYRRRGGGWANETMRMFLDTITTRALDERVPDVGIATWIHEKNEPSQNLCRSVGLAHTGHCMPHTPELQRWSGRLIVGWAPVDEPDPDGADDEALA